MPPFHCQCTPAHAQPFSLVLAEWRTLGPEAEEIGVPAIPMMLARRMSRSARSAVRLGLELMQRHAVDALVFSSRHGELERTFKLLLAGETNEEISPTDFAMSVHNAAVGQLTIIAKKQLPASSVAAGEDSFQQALYEVQSFFASGKKTVLHIDSDANLPAIYKDFVRPEMPAYAAAFVWKNPDGTGEALNFSNTAGNAGEVEALPQSLQFINALLREKKTFCVSSGDAVWQWKLFVK